MSETPVHVTAADISRLAGVTRATVSNWRRRHSDFPAPVAGSDVSPLYDLAAVRAWLESRGLPRRTTAIEELRALLRLHTGTPVVTRLLPLVRAAAHLGPERLTGLVKRGDSKLAAAATRLVATQAADLPAMSDVSFGVDDAEMLRSVLSAVLEEGGKAVLDVLAERELTDLRLAGAYSTPLPLARLMARFLRTDGPYPAVVFDPACGSGALLEAAGQEGATRLLGQDVLDVQALRSAVRLKITMPDRETVIKTGDSLRADAFANLQADAVLCNPPFGDRDWGHEELAYDPRWAYGAPPRGESELAWVQHALAHLAPGGHAVLLMPPSTGLRTSGRAIRTELLKAGALRAVIALPPGVVIPLHVGLHLWVLRRPKPNPTAEPILMMDVSGESSRGESIDWAALSEIVFTSWRSYLRDPVGFEPVPGTARAVPVVELFGDSVDFTPVRHLHRTKMSPAEAASHARRLAEQLTHKLDEISATAAAATWAEGPVEGATWRTATVSDLARGGLLTILHSRPETSADPLPEEYRNRPLLLGRDVATGSRATGVSGQDRTPIPIPVKIDDVLLPRVAYRERVSCRVADQDDAGCLLGPGVTALRVDPARLDPWFLAGFLLSEENLATASRLRQDILLEPRRLKVPLLPLEEQRRYGRAFQTLHRLELAAQEVWNLAAETTRTVSTALTDGSLAPPDA